MNFNWVQISKVSSPCIHWILTLILLIAGLGAMAAAQEVALKVDSSKSTVTFTLGDVLHTVRGTFKVVRGTLRFEPASGQISGEIVVDAKSGESGSGMRDRKMHKEVLESDRFPEIAFRPTMLEGAAATGKFSTKVRGMFSIHGVDREITVPAEVDIEPDHWSANVHFTVPYEKWGMKNPSTLFLRVNDSVEIDLVAAGIAAK
jgi:polyisoprenoid-binding protein YceI